MEEKIEKRFKIVIIGDATTGKTNIIKKYAENDFNKEYTTTMGVLFFQKLVDINGKKIHLDIWDTSGQERFKSLLKIYAKDANCLLFVYDITNKLTFDHIDNWINFIKETIQIPYIALIGNKLDLNTKRKV